MTTNPPTDTSAPAAKDSPSFSEPKAAGTARKRGAARFVTPALALVAALGIGLLGGVLIGQNTASASLAGADRTQGDFPSGTLPDGADGAANPGGPGGFTSGEVVSVDGNTVTLELADGSTVTTTEESSVSQLAAGDTITVVGTADDDGNVAEATAISEGATGFGAGGMGGTPPAGTGTGTGIDTDD